MSRKLVITKAAQDLARDAGIPIDHIYDHVCAMLRSVGLDIESAHGMGAAPLTTCPDEMGSDDALPECWFVLLRPAGALIDRCVWVGDAVDEDGDQLVMPSGASFTECDDSGDFHYALTDGELVMDLPDPSPVH